MFSIREILDLAVHLERNGERVYRDALGRQQDPALQELLEKLAEDEQRHAERFTALKEEWKPSPEDPRLEDMETAAFRGIFGDQTFSLKEADFTRVGDREGLLKLAIEFEKDSILFYEMLQALIVDRDTSRHVGEILEEERAHVEALEALLP